MTERDRVAGLLSGRLAPEDVTEYGVTSDLTLRRIKWAAETLIVGGLGPTTARILVGFDEMKWPKEGIAALCDQLRQEG